MLGSMEHFLCSTLIDPQAISRMPCHPSLRDAGTKRPREVSVCPRTHSKEVWSRDGVWHQASVSPVTLYLCDGKKIG